MRDTDIIIINTGPIIALVAAFGNLQILDSLYEEVIVPLEVCQEIMAGGPTGFGIHEFNAATFLTKLTEFQVIQPFLQNSLDLGESAVIQTAISRNISTVCIDETVGRRIARLNGLRLTGSLGIMIRAKNEGYRISMQEAIKRMEYQGIRISERLKNTVLRSIQ